MGTNIRDTGYLIILEEINLIMILALSLCSVLIGVLIPVMQGNSAMDGFSSKSAYEKPTANGGGKSGAAKDISSEAEARKVSVLKLLKEFGRLHHNEAVNFLGKRQDSPRRDKKPGRQALPTRPPSPVEPPPEEPEVEPDQLREWERERENDIKRGPGC